MTPACPQPTPPSPDADRCRCCRPLLVPSRLRRRPLLARPSPTPAHPPPMPPPPNANPCSPGRRRPLLVLSRRRRRYRRRPLLIPSRRRRRPMPTPARPAVADPCLSPADAAARHRPTPPPPTPARPQPTPPLPDTDPCSPGHRRSLLVPSRRGHPTLTDAAATDPCSSPADATAGARRQPLLVPADAIGLPLFFFNLYDMWDPFVSGTRYFKSHICRTKQAFSKVTAHILQLFFKKPQLTATFSKATPQPNTPLDF